MYLVSRQVHAEEHQLLASIKNGGGVSVDTVGGGRGRLGGRGLLVLLPLSVIVGRVGGRGFVVVGGGRRRGVVADVDLAGE